MWRATIRQYRWCHPDIYTGLIQCCGILISSLLAALSSLLLLTPLHLHINLCGSILYIFQIWAHLHGTCTAKMAQIWWLKNSISDHRQFSPTNISWVSFPHTAHLLVRSEDMILRSQGQIICIHAKVTPDKASGKIQGNWMGLHLQCSHFYFYSKAIHKCIFGIRNGSQRHIRYVNRWQQYMTSDRIILCWNEWIYLICHSPP